MGRLSGRVAIVTGAGRGLGRAHALALAAEGAAVVVNDLGADLQGHGADPAPSSEVVREIEAAGGRAVISGHDVGDWADAEAMVALAVKRFGDLHILVNNAGILRDRTLANMDEREWDAVIRVHLKGHAAPTRHAMAYWKERFKRGHAVSASIVHTSSLAGLVGSFGQANYAAAKLGIVGLSRIAAIEGAKYGVRSNAVSPSARTRIETSLKVPPASEFDVFDPANVSPLIVWLAAADCPATGQVFQAYGNRVELIAHTSIAADLRTDGRWTFEALDKGLAGKLTPLPSLSEFVDGLG
jgi:NAD(P)-dependent dehydrogenase (short-subunit alcohol dehydrogenase family)